MARQRASIRRCSFPVPVLVVAAACGIAAKRTGPVAGSDAATNDGDRATSGEDGAGADSLGDGGDGPLPEVGGAIPDAGNGAPSDATGDSVPAVVDSDTSGGDSPLAVSCPFSSLAAGDYSRSLSLDGGSRTYAVHVPPGLAPSVPAPLVFAFHGGGQTAMAFEGFAHLQTKSDSSGFILVEPEGTPALPGTSPGTLDVWNAGNCCELAAQVNDNVDDVGFVAAMLASLEGELCVDPKRVFATGFSNGAMLAHRLACQLSDRIAAIAAVSGGMGNRNLDVTPVQTLFPCSPGRPVSVLHIHGTQDACYPFDGGYVPLSAITAEPVMTTVTDWAGRNGCSPGPPSTVLTAGIASCQEYPCPEAGEVELCTIDGGGHYWPGGDDWTGSEVVCGLNQGVRSMDLIANDALWTWFQRHPMP
jgi:polyhydroxybutyrate depolymerase